MSVGVGIGSASGSDIDAGFDFAIADSVAAFTWSYSDSWLLAWTTRLAGGGELFFWPFATDGDCMGSATF
jgi:hypothetical protein